jgi:hypothetical protein
MIHLLPGVESWSRKDKSNLARFIRAKAARSEAQASRVSARHERLRGALDPYLRVYPE